MMYKDGRGVNQDYEKAAKLYEKSCDGGEMRGCASLAAIYRYGSENGFKTDDEKPLSCLIRRAISPKTIPTHLQTKRIENIETSLARRMRF